MYLTASLYHKRYKFAESKDKKTWNIEENNIKYRDNYHVILLAKNYDGVKEINTLVSVSNNEDHFYFKPRISFEEFFNISDNVIKISACLASPLWSMKHNYEKYNIELTDTKNELAKAKESLEMFNLELSSDNTVRKRKRKTEDIERDISKIKDLIKTLENNVSEIKRDMYYISENQENNIYEKFLKKYDYYEVQPHVNSNDQKTHNKKLLEWSKIYNKPIVCGTDTHSLNPYLAECRTIMQIAKGIEFLDEDTFDLTCKTRQELYSMFVEQGILSILEIENALDNTNLIADSIEDFELDKTFKYPIFKSPEEDAIEFEKRCWEGLDEKIKCGAIKETDRSKYIDRVNEELRVFKKVNMSGFMLSMQAFIGVLRKQGVPFGFSRGSCFTKDAIVHCEDGLKTIDKVQIGDKVLSSDGQYHKVINTMNRNVDEDLLEFEYCYLNKFYKNTCTLDHLILVKRNNKIMFVEAQCLLTTDRLLSPKIQSKNNGKIYNNDNYISVPITKLNILQNQKTTVYDLTVENMHNFVINNVIVHNCGGSCTAFLTDITDCDPIVWDLSFERFCNESRVSLGD